MQAFALTHAFHLPSGQRRALRSPRRPTTHASVAPQTRATLTPDTPPSAPTPSSPTPASAPLLEDLSPADRERVYAVRSQLEFWFSASNLRRDWYLRRQMDAAGWLDPSVFLLFNRIKQLNASLDDIILASRLSDELEVSLPSPASFGDAAGQTRIRRSTELPDFRKWDESELERSFIVKGIPADSTVESVAKLFEPLAEVSYVHLYRLKEPSASSRALVCFADASTANSVFQRFSAEAPEEAKGLVLKRRDIAPGAGTTATVAGGAVPEATRVTAVVFEVTGLDPNTEWKMLYKNIADVLTHGSGQALRYLLFSPGESECYVTVADTEPVRDLLSTLTEEGLKLGRNVLNVQVLTGERLKEYWEKASEYQAARKKRIAERDASSIDPNSDQLMGRNPMGVIVKLEGLSEEATWQQVKAELQEMGRVVYLNFDKVNYMCYVRMGSTGEAAAVRDALTGEGAATVCNGVVQASILEGEEEEQYWIRVEERQRQRREKYKAQDPPTEEMK